MIEYIIDTLNVVCWAGNVFFVVLHSLKVHLCRFENLPISSCSHKNFAFLILRILKLHNRKVCKCLFTNIQKQQNMFKIRLLFKKNTNFTGQLLENTDDKESKIFRVLFLYEFKYMRRFSNLHQCTFKLYCGL